jgi:uncharacterized protein
LERLRELRDLTAETDLKSRRPVILLIDTGPLVAIIDKKDGLHGRAVEAMALIRSPLATTEACLTETLHLLGDAAGWRGQELLRKMVLSSELRILISPPDGPVRGLAIMEKYKDQPCDYADSSLLIAAEDSGLRRIFAFDGHFYAYRLPNGEALDVIP